MDLFAIVIYVCNGKYCIFVVSNLGCIFHCLNECNQLILLSSWSDNIYNTNVHTNTCMLAYKHIYNICVLTYIFSEERKKVFPLLDHSCLNFCSIFF